MSNLVFFCSLSLSLSFHLSYWVFHPHTHRHFVFLFMLCIHVNMHQPDREQTERKLKDTPSVFHAVTSVYADMHT